MNVKLLRKVAKHISEEPARLDMSGFYWHPYGELRDADAPFVPRHQPAKCGTAACIAGWAVGITDGDESAYNNVSLPARARELLGLDLREADALFFVESWPSKFRHRYMTVSTLRGKVSAAVARIEHFIKTKGKE